MKTEKDSTKRAMNENKGKIADFLTQLQITDFAKMQTLLSPKYRLDRSFKIQDMMPVAQSVRLVRKFDLGIYCPAVFSLKIKLLKLKSFILEVND